MGRFTIISFCGGGIRGLLSARILERLAKLQPNILGSTTLFAGTSTGSGIINLLLAGKSPEEICQFYLGSEREFFMKPRSPITHDEPKYDIAEVAASVFRQHGDKKLSDFKQRVLFTAFSVGQVGKPGVPWEPRLYNNLPRSGTPEVSIVDAVTQSSAMPGMLGSWKGCVDGAFVNHDPSLAAISLAVENGATLDNIALINIGTGLMQDWISDDTNEWGAAQWINGGPNQNAGNQTPPFFVNWNKPTPALDMALCGTSCNLTPMLVGKLLGSERCVNLNPKLDWYIPENSTSEKDMAELQGKAMECDLTQAKQVLLNWSDAQ